MGAVVVPLAAMPTDDSFLADVVRAAAEQHAAAAILALVWGVLVWPARVLNRRLSPPPLNVYLSATLDDMAPYRAAAVAVLVRLGARHLGDPVDAGRPTAPLAERMALVRGCDLFIGLYAWRYGPATTRGAGRQRRSTTDLELEEATNAHVARVLWKRTDDAAWPVRHMDNSLVDVRTLRARVETNPAVHPLPDTPMALARQVETIVMTRQRELYPQQQLLADLTAPSGLVLAGTMGAVTAMSQTVRDVLSHSSSSDVYVVGTALVAFAAAYGVRLFVIRRA
jgi:hypothetical protein